VSPPQPSAPAPPSEPRPAPRQRPGDRIFSGSARAAGIGILVLLAGVAIFLVAESWPAFTAAADELPEGRSLASYVWPLAFGTLLAAAIALIIGGPLAVGIALFISHFAPRRVAQGLGYLVDLLAAVPSVVFGLWGIQWVAPKIQPLYAWLADNLGFVPFFAGPASATGRTILTAGIVLAVMILPIMTAVCREVFLQTPTLHEEAARALGATRWEMIRMAVLPFGRSGIISGAMLALGRALGETMAVALVLSPSLIVSIKLLRSENPSTIAANIALRFPESTGIEVNALIATGLVLFVITLAVNMAARAIVNRRRDFSGAN
jgi:phosphate transport system permease protein